MGVRMPMCVCVCYVVSSETLLSKYVRLKNVYALRCCLGALGAQYYYLKTKPTLYLLHVQQNSL